MDELPDGMSTASRSTFGILPGGREIDSITLANGRWSAEFLTQGAILRSWHWPLPDGASLDVVLGCATVADYARDTSYHGAVVGRYGNRIAGGKFVLDGIIYSLPINNAPNHLHGGTPGFDKAIWDARVEADPVRVVFHHVSPAGDQGYPGTLTIEVGITLGDDGALSYAYRATTDAPTILNPTAHPYFNLAGHDAGSFEADHQLQLHASRYVPKDGTGIPLGAILPVAGTSWDFTMPRGMREPDDHAGLIAMNGYDHTWVVDGDPGSLRPAASVRHTSGRGLDVLTTEPGIHFYNGYYNDGSPAIMKGNGRPAASRSGFALETQHYPDSPNQPGFPSVVLRPGQEFRSTTVYRPVG